MKYIEDPFKEPETTIGVLKDLFKFHKDPPVCDLRDFIEHRDAFERHAEQLYLMMRYLSCHSDTPLLFKSDEVRNIPEWLAAIKWNYMTLLEYCDEFIKMAKTHLPRSMGGAM